MERITPKEMDRMLRQHFQSRSDLGFWNAVAAEILEPQNPFEPRERRRPQRWFVLFLVSSFAAGIAFAYFNFWH